MHAFDRRLHYIINSLHYDILLPFFFCYHDQANLEYKASIASRRSQVGSVE